MRTTLTLDDGIAATLDAEARRAGLPFEQVVNETLRRGLVSQRPSEPQSPRFAVETRDLGDVRPSFSLDNVGELIERLEGPLHR